MMFAGNRRTVNDYVDEVVTRRAPASGVSYTHEDQWQYPYQAIGMDLALSQVDILLSTRSSEFRKIGVETYTYDAYGNVIETVVSVTNVDGVADEIMHWNTKIPDGAEIKMVTIDTDSVYEKFTYYIDPVTGERKDISVYKAVYYKGDVVTMTRKELDSRGNMVEYGKTESRFDSQGRPVETVQYSQRSIYDPSTGTTTYDLRPDRKVEYTYLSGDVVTTIQSYMNFDQVSGQYIWTYSNYITKGTDENGIYQYEYRYYSTYDSTWVGSSKYSQYEHENADGSKETVNENWKWNSQTQEWLLSGRVNTQYNPKGNRTLNNSYEFSTSLQTYYLYSSYGYEYLGDTLCYADWYVYFNRPDSLQQLETPMALLSYGYKNEYVDYTPQELGLTLAEAANAGLPRKYEISYNIDRNCMDSLSWKRNGKQEYDYQTARIPGFKTPQFLKTGQRDYSWRDNDWKLNTEYRYGYNEYGERVMEESYTDGRIASRQTREYKHIYTVDSGDTVMHVMTGAENYWRLLNGVLVPSTTYIYDYDDELRQTLYIYYTSWDTVANSWKSGRKFESEFNSSGDPTLNVTYVLNPKGGDWVGSSKEAYVYNEQGYRLKYEYWYNNSDTATVWILNSTEESQYDDNGNVIFSLSCSLWNGSSWEYGDKNEYSYSDSGQLLEEASYYISSGQWFGNSRETYEYNAAGQMTQALMYYYDPSDGMGWCPYQKETYTYADNNQLLDYYRYELSDTLWYATEKKIAVFENGRITEYADSIFDSWQLTWSPNSSVAVSYDDSTGIVTSVYRDWNSYSGEWQNNRKESQKFDQEGRLLYTESYDWRSYYDYNSQSYVSSWYGDNKAEYAYDEDGQQIMTATYFWNSSDTLWVGNYKTEEAYDKSGNLILQASYYWDGERQDWYGGNRKYVSEYDSNGRPTLSEVYSWDYDNWCWVGSNRTEYEYDADGNEIMYTSYEGIDADGDWIGSYKHSYYTSNNINYSESYSWDYSRKDWRGNYKSEYSSGEGYYLSTSYAWDEEDWCWVGQSKTEQAYTDFSDETVNYGWDFENQEWIPETKELKELILTQTSYMSVLTTSQWDSQNSGWVFSSRETDEFVYKTDDNMDYQLNTIEAYNPLAGGWNQVLAIKLAYVYTSASGVADIRQDLDISIGDGMIAVNADADAVVSIMSVSGAKIAVGKGGVQASVTPGIYLISVDGRTVKVMVR